MVQKNNYIYILLFFLAAACTPTKYNYLSKTRTTKEIKATENRLEKVYYMTLGHFTNEEQAKTETAVIYNAQDAISVPLWTERSGEYWVYVSRMLKGLPEQLLTQEVWEFKRKDPQTISLTIYDIPNKSKYTYDWKKENPLADLRPKDLIPFDKCAIDIVKKEQNFFEARSTPCKRNTPRGVRYIDMIIDFNPNAVIIYSKVMDANKKTVYNLDKGLRFVRIPKDEPRY